EGRAPQEQAEKRSTEVIAEALEDESALQLLLEPAGQHGRAEKERRVGASLNPLDQWIALRVEAGQVVAHEYCDGDVGGEQQRHDRKSEPDVPLEPLEPPTEVAPGLAMEL